MTREDIIEMARKAGGADIESNGYTSWVGTQTTEFLERFAALVAAAERERIKEANTPEIERVNKELRRLHEVNQELLEALKETLGAHEIGVFMSGRGLDKARATIAKAGEKP